MRGGIPNAERTHRTRRTSSPHAWGYTLTQASLERYMAVFPTCVAVYPSLRRYRSPSTRLPHMRGGLPAKDPEPRQRPESSPHAWGYALSQAPTQSTSSVFPTYVRVFQSISPMAKNIEILTQVRGGLPTISVGSATSSSSSPRAWGSTRSPRSRLPLSVVFLTYVEIYPFLRLYQKSRPGLPHMSGDLLTTPSAILASARSYPHAWECALAQAAPGNDGFVSPHAWGYTRRGHDEALPPNVSPACVGIYPASIRICRTRNGLPRMRGGLPDAVIT